MPAEVIEILQDVATQVAELKQMVNILLEERKNNALPPVSLAKSDKVAKVNPKQKSVQDRKSALLTKTTRELIESK